MKAFSLDRENVLGFLSALRDHRNAAQVFLLEEEWADKATLGFYQPLSLGVASSIPSPRWWLLIGRDRWGEKLRPASNQCAPSAGLC